MCIVFLSTRSQNYVTIRKDFLLIFLFCSELCNVVFNFNNRNSLEQMYSNILCVSWLKLSYSLYLWKKYISRRLRNNLNYIGKNWFEWNFTYTSNHLNFANLFSYQISKNQWKHHQAKYFSECLRYLLLNSVK